MKQQDVALKITIATAEKILADTFGGKVQLDEGKELGGSERTIVLRCQVLDGPTAMPASVIVKKSITPAFDSGTISELSRLFFNDWASVEFLANREATRSLVPAFYGGDRSANVFVLEDLGQGQRLDHYLLGDDPVAAEQALQAYAVLHGRLHALSCGQQAEYLHIRERLDSSIPDATYYNYRWLFPTLHSIAATLNISVPSKVDEELAILAASLVNPGPFLTFVQSDAAPDNCLFDGATWRLFDFEGGRYTHALLEGVYCRMPFPTCWCVYRMPEAVIERVEAAYRTELVRGCPEAADDSLFYSGVVGACIAWTLNFQFLRPLQKMLEADRCLIALTDRERFLLYLNAAARASECFHYFAATGATLRAIAVELERLWPEATSPSYYPAFLPLLPMHD